MILTHRTGLPSAKLLRDALFTETGIRYLVTTSPSRIRTLHLRYGTSAGVSCSDTEFNTPEFVNLVSNKLRFANAIKDKFATPEFIRDREPTDDEFPIVVRKTMCGWGGEGIIMCPDRESFDEACNGSYWTRFVKTTQEFRIHVLGGNIGRLFRKVRIRIDGNRPSEEEFPIRTFKSGLYRYSLWSGGTVFPDLVELVSQLDAEIGGKMYALDVGKLPNDGGWFIFEGNTAPGINQHTASAYAKYLVEAGAV
jgi:glutathione synthase/RimK-type ligase-like ATP-grasp enzyme